MPPEIQGDRVMLRRVTAADVPALQRIADTPEVRSWWPEPDDYAQDLDSAEVPRFAVVHDGAVVGLLQCYENADPEFAYAGMDVFLDPAVHGRGLGTATIWLMARWLVGEGGHHRIVIDPAADNAAAIACYRNVGFRPVGIMREYWHDAGSGRWRDGLLMDALPSDIPGVMPRTNA